MMYTQVVEMKNGIDRLDPGLYVKLYCRIVCKN